MLFFVGFFSGTRDATAGVATAPVVARDHGVPRRTFCSPVHVCGHVGLQAAVTGSGDVGKGEWLFCGLEMSKWFLRGNSNLKHECE